MSERPCILVVDDEVDNCTLLARVFRRKYEVLQAYTAEEALELAVARHPDVVITDQRMPGLTGVQLLARLRDEMPQTIRVLVTGYAEYDALVDAVNAAGVHQYFEKPFRAASVLRMVDNLVEKAALERERESLLAQLRQSEANLQQQVEERTRELELALARVEEANRALKEMVVRDGLTGVHNHRYLLEYMAIEIARSSRYGREFGVLFLDIDDFKRVNDEHGHQVGDNVLRAVAEQLTSAKARMRQSDFAARYGGEEFVVILPETGIRGAQIKAERVRYAIEHLEGEGIEPVTVSIGVAGFPLHGRAVDELLRAADAALYEAKRGGKNQVALYAPRRKDARAGSQT